MNVIFFFSLIWLIVIDELLNIGSMVTNSITFIGFDFMYGIE